jgi:hypothetical protein
VDAKTHWNKVYTARAPDALSGYRAHLEASLALIERATGGKSSCMVDIGGGESTLVDDLLLRGYRNLTVLDVSQVGVEVTKKRLGDAARQVRWIVADVTEASSAFACRGVAWLVAWICSTRAISYPLPQQRALGGELRPIPACSLAVRARDPARRMGHS